MKTFDLSAAAKKLAENKYVLLVLLLGLVLILLPGGSKSGASGAAGEGDALEASGIPLDTECARIASLLSGIEGVGDATVLLSKNGAVVVCTGADSPQTRLLVTQAVAAYTGLGSDRITVMKSK